MTTHTTIGSILLVEDHAPLRHNLTFLLEIAGFSVTAAADGLAALAALDEVMPDIILSDVDMPRLDGYGLLAEVRDSLRWRHVPFILTSANYEYDDLINGLELGANDYLPKPFDIYDVLDAIERAAPELIGSRSQRKAG